MIAGPIVRQILESGDDVDIALNAEVATVYSKSFRLVQGTSFSVWLKAAGTTVRMDVFLEQSYALPTTEGAADANWVVPEGNSPVLNDLSDTNAHIVTNVAPAVMPYGRLKLVPNVGNSANVTLQAVLGFQAER